MVARQRGSVLVGVVGITTLLSLSAAGLLLIAANSRNEEDLAFQRARCAFDAESGLMLGVAWLKAQVAAYGTTYITQSRYWPDDTYPLGNPRPLTLDNNSKVYLTIHDKGASKTLVSRAENGSEVVQYSWDVGIDVNSKITLNNWRQN